MERAQLDLDFTKVTAPVSGRISRYYVTVGNLVQAGDQTGGTLLTTIVSVDPMYAYFDVDEHTVLRVKQLIREGKAKTPDDPDIPVWLGLANEDGFPHRGTINFIDNQVNPRTGTLRVRGVFPNKDEALSPGYFARVRVPIGVPHKALLVTERALDTDQGQKVVYVVDKRQPGGLPARSPRGAPRRPARDHRRPEARRAGDRQRPAAGPAGHDRGAEPGGHADLRRGERTQASARRKCAVTGVADAVPARPSYRLDS